MPLSDSWMHYDDKGRPGAWPSGMSHPLKREPRESTSRPSILVVVTGNFLHEHHDPASQGGIINSHERFDQPCLKPSGSETKSSIGAIHGLLSLAPSGAEAFGVPSKKNVTGT